MAFEAFRQRLGSIIGGFDAAQAHRRLRGFRASRAHVNTLIAASGDTITARARWLVRNNGYAANAVESFASNVVGDGIKPSSTIADAAKKEELQALWLAWTDDADAEGLTDFYGLQRRAAREVFLSGEVFIRIRPRRAEDGLTVPLQAGENIVEFTPTQTGAIPYTCWMGMIRGSIYVVDELNDAEPVEEASPAPAYVPACCM